MLEKQWLLYINRDFYPKIHFRERNLISLTYLIVNVFVLGMFVLKTPENRLMYIVVDKHQRAALKFLVCVNWLFTKQMNMVMNMFNHNLLSPFSPLSTEDVICLQKLLTVCVWLYFCLHVTKRTWSGQTNILWCSAEKC